MIINFPQRPELSLLSYLPEQPQLQLASEVNVLKKKKTDQKLTLSYSYS